jgi:hypothetical protein
MSTIERLAGWLLAIDLHPESTRTGMEVRQAFRTACNPITITIAQADAEYAALVAERDALREALTGMVAQHGCDCGHPHCNRCAETRECKAALAQGEVGNG